MCADETPTLARDPIPAHAAARYQIILLEPGDDGTTARLEATLWRQITALGVGADSVTVLCGEQAVARSRRAPAAAVYFGTAAPPPPWVDLVLAQLIDNVPILPVVEDLTRFRALVPTVLHARNGREMKSDQDLDAIACNVLENLDLLRRNRRIFISYRRVESRGVAVQLYEALDAGGYDVFLDTHSIRGSEMFQDELMQRLSDVDLVVVLDTPKFLDSTWTEQELAFINAHGIGFVQLVWPNQTLTQRAAISLPIRLNAADFCDGHCSNTETDRLQPATIREVVSAVEGFRARSVGHRHTTLIGDLCAAATGPARTGFLHWRRCVVIEGNDGRRRTVAVPVVGVPDAERYHDIDRLSEELSVDRALLVYNPSGIRDRWHQHLEWLNKNVARVRGIQIGALHEALDHDA